jgi:hypothetical protein
MLVSALLGMSVAGCNSGGNNGKAGLGGSGGSSCSSVTACGGDVVGTWATTSSCLTVSSVLEASAAGLSCATAPVSGSLQVSGTLIATGDGTYSDETVTSGTEEFVLAKSCLSVSSTPIGCDQAANVVQTLGFASVTCSTAADGGCLCTATIHQSGGIGNLSPSPSTSGNFTTSDNAISLSSDSANTKYSYCVSGSKLTMTPQAMNPSVTGAIVLQKSGTAGTGGSGGTGATSGTGGTTGSGGRGGAGGTGATGGSGATDAGSAGSGGAAGSGGVIGPCDIFAAAGTPCVAAHSTVRALLAGYSKPLYQVRKVSDGSTRDIPLLAGTGIADASVQDAFCGTTARACTISIVYDQTGNGNDLKVAAVCPTCSGCPSDGTKMGQPDVEAFADGAKISVAGHPAYGVRILPCGSGIPNQTGYRVRVGNKVATGDQPESGYFVVDGVNTNASCCFDYGNASTNLMASGNMDAVEFSRNKFWGFGAGNGPWVAADLEAGVYTWNGGSGNFQNPNSQSLPFPFVTALMKNNQNGRTADEGPFVLKGGDARSGTLTTMWSGARPNGYATLNKGGGIVLGIGGDNAAGAAGSFFEGAITASFNAKATDDALQANIVAAGYGR